MSRNARLDVSACVFDAYGTLLDINAAAKRCRGDLGPKADPLAALWRSKQLEYSWLRSLMGSHADFWQVTGDALDYAMETLGLTDAALRARLMELYRVLDAYPEAKATLETLKRAGIPCAILSNGTPGMLASAIQSAGIVLPLGKPGIRPQKVCDSADIIQLWQEHKYQARIFPPLFLRNDSQPWPKGIAIDRALRAY